MMGISVVHPVLLIGGLACIAIPILVHLLRRRYRPVTWGAMRFLEQAYKKRKRLITIEQLLLLLTRCAIIAIIAGAVGSLMLGSGLKDPRPRTLILVLDNSIHGSTMLDPNQSALAYQQQRALELLETLNPTDGDRAALITLGAPAQGEAIPATSELGLIRSRIQSVQATDAQRDLDGALALLAREIDTLEDNSIPALAFLLSPSPWDRAAEREALALPGIASVMLDTPSAAQRENIAITSADPLRPMITRSNTPLAAPRDEIQGIRVVLDRTDASPQSVSTLIIEDAASGTQLAQASLSWSIGQSRITQSIALDPSKLDIARGGSSILRVRLNEPVSSSTSNTNPRDDARLVGLPVRRHIGVGIIDSFGRDALSSIRPSRWVRAVLGADEGLVSIQQINAGSAGDRIDPTLDVLIVLAPESVDDRGWSRITRLNALGMPIFITAGMTAEVSGWIAQLDELAPSMLASTPQLRSFDPAIGLSAQLDSRDEAHAPLLAGIRDEYPALASSVTITQRLSLTPGTGAEIVLMDSEGEPLALVSKASDDEFSGSSDKGPVVLMGIALDADWTDLPARPLFVAMMHEMLRSLLARSIAPDQYLAGADASRVPFDDLESLLKAQGLTGPSHAGAYVLVDSRGTSTRPVIINPDTRGSIVELADQESASSVVARSLVDIEIEDLSSLSDLSAGTSSQSADPAYPIAPLLFATALALGLLEILLARMCSYKAVPASIVHPGGS